jgi:hypothetical protein
MDFKETFLKLTENTIPFGHEDTLVNLLPNGVKKDSIGNYYIKIGESKTIFTSHLDTYSKEYQKVNHVIDGNIISTDGTTILGGDNKAGVTCLLYMIENNVPGLYFFFCGEEPLISGGLFGSKALVKSKLNALKKYDRAIAFDRKQTGSIITRQMAEYCCSNEFVDDLILQFSKQGVEMQKDNTGYYTDTAAFLDVIPECTNISIGVWNEHLKNEYVDISYVEKIAKAAIKIDWESLPIVRSTEYFLKDEADIKKPTILKKMNVFNSTKNDEKIFSDVCKMFENDFFVLKSRKGFDSGKEMVFNHWFDETQIKVIVNNGKLLMNGKEVKPDMSGIMDFLDEMETKK